MTDSDIDSDEEIRRMVVAQDSSHATLLQEMDEDNLEVVGFDYLVKSGGSRQQQNGNRRVLNLVFKNDSLCNRCL